MESPGGALASFSATSAGTKRQNGVENKTTSRALSCVFRSGLAGILATAVLGAGPAARADERTHAQAAADALFREGRSATIAGNHEVACTKFRESQRLEPAPGTLLNLGNCEERLGHVAFAWQAFRDAARILGGDPRAEVATRRAEALAPRLAFVTLELPRSAPAGTRVIRDDVEMEASALGLELPVDPGAHVVVVRAPGRGESRKVFEVASGDHRLVTLDLAPANDASATATARATPRVQARSGPSSALPWVAFSAAGAGLVALGIGAWQVLDAKDVVARDCRADDTCGQEGLDAAARGKAFSLVATTGAAVMIAGAALGTFLLVGPSRRSPAVRASAAPLPGGGGLWASVSF